MNIGSSPKTILVLGGYGTFGSRLCRLLSTHTPHTILVAGRNARKAQAHCEMFGGTPAELDRNALNEDMLRRLGVQILVDASGPFSCDTPDPYKVIKSCLAASAHYIDLSDDTDFTLGVSQFDNEATAKGLVVTSGASTVPSISAAAADQLTHDMKHIEFIDSTILPGNRAPRGLSVIQSIIHQAGRPFAGWSEGVVSRTIGWSKPERQTIHVSPSRSIKPRWTSLVATPDTKIFPERYGAENITVRAGLELSLMHLGLYALSFLPRIKMVQTLLPLAKLLQITANFLKPFGSDEGGMRVDVGGRRADNSVVKKSWLLHAGSGDGPFIPALPAFILCRILGSEPTKAGAGPSVGQITYPDVIASLELIDTATVTRTEECKCLFETALGKDWQRLPASLRRAHAVVRRRALRGRAKVERGASPLAWLICQIFRFPPTSKDTSVNVTFEHRGDKEIWRRTFGGSPFRSVLKAAGIETGCVEERFGLFTFQIALSVADGGLHFPVTRGRCLGVPIPAFLLPKSEAREFADETGRFHFEIELSLPLIGRIVRYEGWLEPVGRANPRHTLTAYPASETFDETR